MWCTVSCPSSSRYRVAMVAPSALSTATDVSGAWVPQPTATSGTSPAQSLSATTAEVSGAITMIPSTPWPTKRSTASSTERRSSDGRLAMATK